MFNINIFTITLLPTLIKSPQPPVFKNELSELWHRVIYVHIYYALAIISYMLSYYVLNIQHRKAVDVWNLTSIYSEVYVMQRIKSWIWKNANIERRLEFLYFKITRLKSYKN